MDVRSELERLIAEQLDGAPDVRRNGRLAELLRAHPELQAEYLDHLQIHALLQWRGGQTAPPSAREKSRPAQTFTRARRGLVAALFVTAAGLAAVFLLYSPQAQATPDLVERLIEMNLDLSQTAAPEDRLRIFDHQAAPLKAKLAQADLVPGDRELANTLLENGSWLTKNNDPIAEAERFNDIADKLVTRMDAATTAKDEKRIVQLASTYQRVAEVGIDSNLERAVAAGAKDVEQTTMRHAKRTKLLAAIADRNPEPSRRLIHRAMKGRPAKAKTP